MAILSFGFYLVEKTFNIIDWAAKSDQQSMMRPEVSVDLHFPYEKANNSLQLNKLNPKFTITNRGKKNISPIKADMVMFMLEPSLDKVISAGIFNHETQGHLIFKPELKPRLSVSASLPGVKNWTNPAAYSVNIEVIILNEKKFPDISLLYLVDKDGIKAGVRIFLNQQPLKLKRQYKDSNQMKIQEKK